MLAALLSGVAFAAHLAAAGGAGLFLCRIEDRVGSYWRNWIGLTACLAVAVSTYPFAS